MPTVSRGGIDSTKAHTSADASFVAQANSNKTNNAIPMYAFTLRRLQIPTPTKRKKREQKTSSSLRKRRFRNFPRSALMATEKTAESRKISAAIVAFCIVAFNSARKVNGRTYGVKGANATKPPRHIDKPKRGKKPVAVDVLLVPSF